MKPFLALFLLLLGVSSLSAGIQITVIPIQREKSQLRQLPVVVQAAKQNDGELSVKFALAEFQDPSLKFDAYDLRVLSKPVAEIDLQKDYHQLELIAKKERSRQPAVSFWLKPDEIANAYFVVSFWKKREPGQLGQLLSYCIPAALLLE